MSDVKIGTAREPYEPPVVEDIPLHAEEQVLHTCKVAGSSGPGPLECHNVVTGAACAIISGS
jgi:hypothetical protein